MLDSGEEVIISVDADGHVLDSGYPVVDDGEHTYSVTAAEEAMIKHYEDFHFFLYGFIPALIAVLICISLGIWFYRTFCK